MTNKSQCCNAPMKSNMADEGTSYWLCRNCGKTTDPKPTLVCCDALDCPGRCIYCTGGKCTANQKSEPYHGGELEEHFACEEKQSSKECCDCVGHDCKQQSDRSPMTTQPSEATWEDTLLNRWASGDFIEDVQVVLDFIQSTIDTELEKQRDLIVGELEGIKQTHEIDMELYNDSGGGEMCIYCGKQGYLDKKEVCDSDVNFPYNQAIEHIKSLGK